MGKLSSTFSVFVWVHVFERIPTSPKQVACILPMSVGVRDMVYVGILDHLGYVVTTGDEF